MTGVYRPAILEWEQVLRAPVFAPRRRPTPIPNEDWNTGLIRCFHISDAWIPHLLGVLEALDQPDTWIGTSEEIEAARQNVREIMNEIAGAGECEEMPAEYVKSITECDNGALKWIRVIDGEESEIQMDLASCLVPPLYVRTITTCNDGVIEFEEVEADTVTTREIDVQNCLVLPTAMLTGLVCDETGFSYKAWTRVTGEQTISFDLEECIDIPPTPVPSLVDGDLWFDTDGDSIADLNVGQVVFPGVDGVDGADAPIPGVYIAAGDLYFDAEGDDTYVNLGQVKGEKGDDGECLGCEAMPAPDLPDEPTNDGLQCSIAINEAKYLRSIWDKAYNDDAGFISGYINALITGASVLAYFFPGAAVAAFIGGLLLSLLKGINELEANEFDNDFEEKVRCDLYCILKDNATTVIDPTIIAAWSAKIREGSNIYEAYAADLVDYTPISEFQWTAYASSAVDPAACLDCECEGAPGLCEGSDVVAVGATDATVYTTDFTLPVGCCYTITWNGNVRVGGTVGAPIMGDGNRQQVTSGSWATTTFSGDILQWNTGTGWTRIVNTTPYNPSGYSVVVASTGVALQLRWFAANYTNNSGTMSVTVTGDEC